MLAFLVTILSSYRQKTNNGTVVSIWCFITVTNYDKFKVTLK